MNQPILIIYAHFSRDGHNGYFLTEVESLLRIKNQSYEIIDLYQSNFNPILEAGQSRLDGVKADVLVMQEKIKQTEKFIFIYPTWWQNMPAILKGFLDRVLVTDFAYRYENNLPVGLLKGKQAVVFTTTGGPTLYSKIVKCSRSLKVMTKDTLGFCGFKTKGFVFGGARVLNDNNKKQLQRMAKKAVDYLV